MSTYEEEVREVKVPPGTGVPGLIKAVTQILELPRVQSINITVGKPIEYRRMRKAEEPEANVDLDFSTLLPSQIVRSRIITEVKLASMNAAIVVGQLFMQASIDGYNPVAFVGHPASKFWAWYTATTQLISSREELFGLPFLTDDQIPVEALILCAAHGRRASMVDVLRSYKIAVPIPKPKKVSTDG